MDEMKKPVKKATVKKSDPKTPKKSSKSLKINTSFDKAVKVLVKPKKK